MPGMWPPCYARWMREGITVEVSAVDRAHPEAVMADRNARQKHAWRRQRLRRGSFPSLEALNRFLAEHSRSPKPFVWTADLETIIDKVRQGFGPRVALVFGQFFLGML